MDIRTILHATISSALTNHLWLEGRNVRLFEPHSIAPSEGVWWHNFLKGQFEAGLFKPEDFRNAVAKGIKVWGLVMYDHVINCREYPDHVVSPPALAYVLKNWDFTHEMAKKIRFDRGETLEQFKSRADGLIEDVLVQLAKLE